MKKLPTIYLAIAWAMVFFVSSTMGQRKQLGLSVKQAPFGNTVRGATIEKFSFSNSHGMSVEVMTYGATLISVRVPDRDGKIEDVNLRLDTCDDYLKGHPLFGSIVGRYANRISTGSFKLGDHIFELTKNMGHEHHIHGGKTGFQKLIWEGRQIREKNEVGVRLTHTSSDGDEGYPGNLHVEVIYTLNEANELKIKYKASTDQPTHLNLTNHAYWNLAGIRSGEVLDHIVTIDAKRYLLSDKKRLPTGKLAKVKETPFDFLGPHLLGERFDQLKNGYDHCFVLEKSDHKEVSFAAKVIDLKSGRSMEVYTTEPGIQLYTANGLSSRYTYQGHPYGKYHAFCLEAQHYPDSPNIENFPSTLLLPAQTYEQTTVHRFGVVK